jgi:translation initiation factor 5B
LIGLFNAAIAERVFSLFDAFTAYNAEILEAKRKDSAPKAVFPCRLKTIACFAKRDPIILGVDVSRIESRSLLDVDAEDFALLQIVEGSLRVGTPLCAVRIDPETKKKEIVPLGKVSVVRT